MIDIKIPREIKSYKEKIYFGLDLRQLICVIIAIAINVPLYWYGRKVLGDDITSWVIIFVSLPLMSIGFVNYNGMQFEEIIVAVLNNNYLKTTKRKYKTKNLYRELENYIDRGKGNV